MRSVSFLALAGVAGWSSQGFRQRAGTTRYSIQSYIVQVRGSCGSDSVFCSVATQSSAEGCPAAGKFASLLTSY